MENNENSDHNIIDIDEAIENESPSTSSVLNYKIHFKVSGLKDKIGVCLLCEKKNIDRKIKMKNANTTGLKRHLERYHKDIYDSKFAKNKEATLDQLKLTDMLSRISSIMFCPIICIIDQLFNKNYHQLDIESTSI
ncbi:hypothetical protein ALC62_06891 [Cyphomyrmex costatus]|uniref:BED-type domain-containing protein n=1 Tax=Cyphomyrmex costatus TaxID=456900 RepID=A0A151II85_9HYME|nr:hypothetical protein ALC62_06891 [Cyphomyrmex costatus]